MTTTTPATPEPVLTVEKEPDYWSKGHFYEGNKPYISPTKVRSLPIGTKLYTRPAPGVPEGFALVPVEPTEEMTTAVEHAMGDKPSVKGADVWSAVLAAAQAKGAGHA